ncbi:hypothetical protein IWQ62_002158 [Dispira parvispora]|uniref:DUF7707 domain-containing protein n=1 Tax=Dispira parvispora TaxID=1520584 RepID=A0A9W8E7S4_9FUNG|nr:hypothetical protein IWQ62_002158 [Dispira parvispora]
MKAQLAFAVIFGLLSTSFAATSTTEEEAKPSATKSASKPSSSVSVSKSQKNMWCNQNNAFCKNVCQNITSSASVATCDSDTLVYDCRCKNGETPDSTEWNFPIPYYTCVQGVTDCQKNCDNGDTTCHQGCQKDCAAVNDPFAGNTTSVPTQSSDDTNEEDSEDIFDNAALSTTTTNVAFVAGMAALLMGMHQL